MSPRNKGTEFTPTTEVSIHAGNPDLLQYDEAKQLLRERELQIANEVAPTTPQIFIKFVGERIAAARTERLEGTITMDEDDNDITPRNLDQMTRNDFELAG